MLFALLCTVCVKKAICVDAMCAVACKGLCLVGVADRVCVEGNTRGRFHRSVEGSFLPCKITLPLYRMMHLCLSKVTSRPAFVRTCIPNNDAMERLGMICPISVIGRPFIFMSYICVDMTCRQSASDTHSGVVVGCLLATGAPSITKIWVVPESAMASVGGGSRQIPMRMRWLVFDMDVLDVTMVALSSPWMDKQKLVGYGKILVLT